MGFGAPRTEAEQAGRDVYVGLAALCAYCDNQRGEPQLSSDPARNFLISSLQAERHQERLRMVIRKRNFDLLLC